MSSSTFSVVDSHPRKVFPIRQGCYTCVVPKHGDNGRSGVQATVFSQKGITAFHTVATPGRIIRSPWRGPYRKGQAAETCWQRGPHPPKPILFYYFRGEFHKVLLSQGLPDAHHFLLRNSNYPSSSWHDLNIASLRIPPRSECLCGYVQQNSSDMQSDPHDGCVCFRFDGCSLASRNHPFRGSPAGEVNCSLVAILYRYAPLVLSALAGPTYPV